MADGTARAVVVISKNANVATGQQGHDDAIEVARSVAARLGCEPTDVVVTSTGVIGRRYPIDRIRGRDRGAAERADIGRRRWPRPRDDDHRHRAQARRGDRRREHRPCRRHGEGRRDDRARHGDAHLVAVHRCRTVVGRPRRRLPAGGRSDVQLRERRHRHLDERLVGDHGVGRCRPGRPRRVRGGAVRGGARSDQADRPRRRGRPFADRGARRRRPATPLRPSGWPRRSSTHRW